jgi:hypothetical protein
MRRAILAALALGPGAPALAAQPPAATPPAPVVAAAPDPQRLAAAERLVDLVMPEEVLRRMLSQGIPGMELAMDMSEAERGSAGDPDIRERMQIMSRVSGEVMGEMMGELQPLIARASADYFARRLTLAELDELVGLFSTPAGRKFAEAWLGLSQDPGFTEMMRPMLPLMIQMSARIDERVRAASAHLRRPPPPPPPLDVAPEEAPEAEADDR